jgi:hypothetical protein
MSEQRTTIERGQSLVLVAAAMVVLVGFVALAVDLGNAYYTRRTAQNAADGASLAGVSVMATGINDNNNNKDDEIDQAMNDFAERNGVPDTDPDDDDVNDNVEGYYVDASGNRLEGVWMVGEAPESGQNKNDMPEGAFGIEAITHITATSFFGGIFGFDGYPIQARAVSLLKLVCDSDCVVPFTVDIDLLVDPETNELRDTCFHIWTERDKHADDISMGALGWVNWTWQESVSVCTALNDPESYECWDERPCPASQGPGCQEGALEANLNGAINCANGFVKVGDWMNSATGDMGSTDVRCWLSYYVGYEDPDVKVDKQCTDGEPHSITVPVYDVTTAELEDGSSTPCLRMTNPCDYKTGGLHYRVAGFAQAQLLQYQLTSSGHEVPPDELVRYPTGLDSLDSCYDYYDLDLSSCDDLVGELYDACVEAVKDDVDAFRITISVDDYVQDAVSSSSCSDPWGTLLASPRLVE